jgi:uncharacterized membrane protein YjjB (DUF3815 family)
MVLSTFLAAFAVGLISFWLSRRYKHPSQIYSLPSIVSLVPGLMAFSSFGYGQASRASSAETINFVIHALLISLAIVFGLAFGRVTLTKKQWIGAY